MPDPGKVMKGGSRLCAPNYCRRYRPAARMARPSILRRASGFPLHRSSEQVAVSVLEYLVREHGEEVASRKDVKGTKFGEIKVGLRSKTG